MKRVRRGARGWGGRIGERDVCVLLNGGGGELRDETREGPDQIG